MKTAEKVEELTEGRGKAGIETVKDPEVSSHSIERESPIIY